MSETHARDTARPVAGRARPRWKARLPAPRYVPPVVTPRPRTELLVLTKHELGKRTAELFTALAADPELRARFARDPMGVVAERVHEHRANAQAASEIDRFIVTMLADDGLMTWYRDRGKACSDVDEHELVEAFGNALVEHADESLLVCLVEGATMRVSGPGLGDAAQQLVGSVATPVSQPPSGRGNVSTNTASRELHERVMSPAFLRVLAENLFERADGLGAGVLTDPAAIVR
jgi:hypothetical protein